MASYPSQKKSYAEKDDVFVHSTVDYFIESAFGSTDDDQEMDMLYRAVQGALVEDDYKYVTNPYNSDNDLFKNFPAKLRNYDIISPIVNLYLGEKWKKPTNFQVVVGNTDADNQMKQELNKQMTGLLTQQFMNTLNTMGVKTGVQTQPVPSPSQAASQFEEEYDDVRARIGQQAVDYLHYDLDLKDAYQRGFYDYLVTGRVVTYKDVYRNDVDHEIVPPYEIRVVGEPENGYIEDATAVVRTQYLTPAQIVDRFRSSLHDEDILWLEQQGQIMYNLQKVQYMHVETDTNWKSTSSMVSGDIPVHHVVWKSFKKVGILKYYNELGIESEREVDEKYKLNTSVGDIELKWEWINEVWEGYRIGDSIYVGGEPMLIQREELNNSSVTKLPYNGKFNRTKDGSIWSFVKSSLPYQSLYNIFKYNFEKTMAKNKDKIMLMPLGLLGEGWDETKFTYYMDATSVAWFDETAPNAAQVLQALKSIDMNLGQYAAKMWDFIQGIKQEYWDNVGVNRQRYGDVDMSAGKSVTEQAIFRSSIISEEMFRGYEKFEEKDVAGLLDYSKFAWIEGKKGTYITSDGRKAFLNINGVEYLESDHNVFVKNSADERDKLTALKQVAFALAQNGEDTEIVTEVIDATNYSKVKGLIKKAKAIQKQFEEAQAQADRDTQMQIQQMKSEDKQLDFQKTKYSSDMSYQATIESALINANVQVYGHNVGNAESPSNIMAQQGKKDIERLKLMMEQKQQEYDRWKANSELAFKEKELAFKERDSVRNVQAAKSRAAKTKIPAKKKR